MCLGCFAPAIPVIQAAAAGAGIETGLAVGAGGAGAAVGAAAAAGPIVFGVILIAGAIAIGVYLYNQNKNNQTTESPDPADKSTSTSQDEDSNDDWPELSGALRDAAKGKGNFGIGQGTAAQAEQAGKAWVGDDYKVASDEKTLVSKDGLRQWRPPSYKPRLGKTQSNFDSRQVPHGEWQSNGHFDVTDKP